MRHYFLARKARKDLAKLLSWSAKKFGEDARLRYLELIDVSALELCDNPERLGAKLIVPGRQLYAYHLRHSKDRAITSTGTVASPRHVLIYKHDLYQVHILRVLHDSMDILRHL